MSISRYLDMANMEKTEVILVDKNNQEVGGQEKIKAHKLGQLHRAFSVFIFNRTGELLLQKRSAIKYHSPLLWTNTCCSHPRPKKNIRNEAQNRLKEEMGFVCRLKEIFVFSYKVRVPSPFFKNLIENEIDHCFVGYFNNTFKPNPKEATDFRWQSLSAIKKDIKLRPGQFTTWFKKVFRAKKTYQILCKARMKII